MHDAGPREGQRLWRQRFGEPRNVILDQLLYGRLRCRIREFPDHGRDMRRLRVSESLEFNVAGVFQQLRPFCLQNGLEQFTFFC